MRYAGLTLAALVFAIGCERQEPQTQLIGQPLTSSLWATQVATIAPPATAQPGLGASVAVDGQFAIAGAPDQTGPGRAIVFHRVTGAWGVAAVLDGPGPAADGFGVAVAISGDTAVVGAALTGQVVVYRWDGVDVGAWSEVARKSGGPGFGAAVALDGDDLAIGEPSAAGGDGAVHTYARDAGGSGAWGLVQTIASAEVGVQAALGTSVSLDSGQLAVGAPLSNKSGATSGRVTVHRGSPVVGVRTSWTEDADVTAVGASPGDRFGTRVRIDGDVLAATSPGGNNSEINGGLARVFLRNRGGPNAWGQLAEARPSEPGVDAQFGEGLGLEGLTMVVGTPRWATDGLERGRIHVFTIDLAAASAIEVATSDGPSEYDSGWGTSVDFASGELFAGVPRDAGNGVGTGKLAVFTWSPATLELQEELYDPAGPIFDEFGDALAASERYLFVGQQRADVIGADSGALYVYDADDLGAPPIAVIAPAGAGAGFGALVAVNGAELAVTAPYDDEAAAEAGAAYLFDATPPFALRHKILPIPAEGLEGMGRSLAFVGDVLALGGNNVVNVFERNAGGAERWGVTARLTGESDFGAAVALNGVDLFVGDPSRNTTVDDAGSVYLFRASRDAAERWPLVGELEISPRNGGAGTGEVLATAGDILMVAGLTDMSPTGDPASGRVFALVRDVESATGWTQTATFQPDPDRASARLGTAMLIHEDLVAVTESWTALPISPVHILHRHAGGTNAFGIAARISDPQQVFTDRFGSALAVSGERLYVGARGSSLFAIAGGRVHAFDPGPNSAPTATADTTEISTGREAMIPVLANDSDPDGDSLIVVLEQPPEHGRAYADALGQVVYSPDEGYVGNDQLTYRASDCRDESAAVPVTIAVTGTECGEKFCAADETCFANACFASCQASETCSTGSCFDGRCSEDVCDEVQCTGGNLCHGGACFAACVTTDECAAGQCFAGRCAGSACENVTCATEEFCVGGSCFAGCETSDECPADLDCIQGRCTASACDGIACASGTVCESGECVTPASGCGCRTASTGDGGMFLWLFAMFLLRRPRRAVPYR